MMNHPERIIIGVVSGFFLMALVSCQSALFTYNGNVVEEDTRIALERDGAGDGTWETRDVLLRCQYKEANGRLELSGEVRIADHLRNSYSVVDSFHLTILFLDAEGRVIDSVNQSLGPYRKEAWEMSFERSVETPENARAIAFGYSGKLTSFNPHDSRRFFGLPFE